MSAMKDRDNACWFDAAAARRLVHTASQVLWWRSVFSHRNPQSAGARRTATGKAETIAFTSKAKPSQGVKTFPFQPTGAPTGAPNAPSSAAAAFSQRLEAAAGRGQTGPQARGKGPCRPAPLADPCGGSPTGAPCHWLGGICPAKKEDFIAARVQRSKK